MKKVVLMILMTLVLVGTISTVYAQSLDSVMKQFQEAQGKLRELRKSGASQAEVSAQEARIKELRSKASKLQSEMGL